MKPLDIVREYFPGLSDKDANSVLWTCTGWPSFFQGGDKETVLRQQLTRAKSVSNGDWRAAMAEADTQLTWAEKALKKTCPVATKYGATGDPKCPVCESYLGHGKVHGMENRFCCGNCKLVFRTLELFDIVALLNQKAAQDKIVITGPTDGVFGVKLAMHAHNDDAVIINTKPAGPLSEYHSNLAAKKALEKKAESIGDLVASLLEADGWTYSLHRTNFSNENVVFTIETYGPNQSKDHLIYTLSVNDFISENQMDWVNGAFTDEGGEAMNINLREVVNATVPT